MASSTTMATELRDIHEVSFRLQPEHTDLIAVPDLSLCVSLIALTKQKNNRVKGQIESGHFGNGSEYIHDLIRRDKLAKERLAALRQAFAEGESSGEPRPLDISAIKAVGRKRARVED